MTAIIGHASRGAAFLSTDTRRRDHSTGQLREQRKLHQWSNQVLIAQGGAGTGAADVVLASLWENQKRIGPDVDAVEAAIAEVAPPLMACAIQKWRGEGKTIPATKLILASVCTDSNSGMIRAIDLASGMCVHESKAPQPYMTGSDTPAIVSAVSEEFHRLRDTSGAFSFDCLAVNAIMRLSVSHACDIQLPADVGSVRWDPSTNSWAVRIERGLNALAVPDPAFRASA